MDKCGSIQGGSLQRVDGLKAVLQKLIYYIKTCKIEGRLSLEELISEGYVDLESSAISLGRYVLEKFNKRCKLSNWPAYSEFAGLYLSDSGVKMKMMLTFKQEQVPVIFVFRYNE